MKNKSISFILAKWALIFYLFVGIFAPFLAGDVPIFTKQNGNWSLPILKEYNPFNDYNHSMNERYVIEESIMPLIIYAPNSMDQSTKTNVKPFTLPTGKSWQYYHWLGTDKLGRDVASGMIHGTSTALKIAGITVTFCFLIGVSIGMISAYFGNDNMKMNIAQCLSTFLLFFAGMYYIGLECLVFSHSIFIFTLCVIGLMGTIAALNHFLLSSFHAKKYSVNLDLWIMKIIEVRKSIPSLFLVLALVAIFDKPSLWNIIFILTLLGWTEFARYARAETMAIKEENYILSSRILGFNDSYILYRHVLPNIMPTLLVVSCFAASSAILAESSLSFLGIGLPVEEISWGKILAEGRKNINAWWLVVFPGFAIFIFILCLNIIANRLQNLKS